MLSKVLVLALAVIAANANPISVTVPTTTGSVSFESPNYPGQYPHNVRYVYNVVGPAGSGLEFNAEAFSLENACSYDSLTITELVNNAVVTLAGPLCGTNGPSSVRSTTNQVTVVFKTDGSVAATGFKINVKVPICAAGQNLCPGSDSACFAPSKYCDGTPDCPEGTDELNCPEPGSCGVPNIQPTLSRFQSLIQEMVWPPAGKIVGGTVATPHSWPWQVLMLTSSGSYICGGSVLSNEWIMTAAHCCEAYAAVPASYKVRVGVHSRMASNVAGDATLTLSRLIVHPGYVDRPAPQNDFCLLKTSTPMILSQTVSPVCLPDATNGPAGQKCWVTGWGETRGSLKGFEEFIASVKAEEAGVKVAPRAVSDVLRQVGVDVVTNTVCNAAYGSITPEMICAASPGKDSCQGDSGGPFVCQNAQGAFKLVGVVSWGRGCAMAGYPGVYARTSSALDWIATTMNS